MRKIGILVITLVLALGALGVGYAYWTQDIYVNAAVNNGYIQASFDKAQSTPTFVDLGDTAGVAWYTSDITDWHAPGDVLTITLDNAYPGMTAVIPVTIKNTGSIPIGNISSGVFDVGTMPSGTTGVLTAAELPTGLYVGSSTSDAKITLKVPWGPLNDPNYLPKGSYTCSLTITATQFDSEVADQFDGYTGVTAGTDY